MGDSSRISSRLLVKEITCTSLTFTHDDRSISAAILPDSLHRALSRPNLLVCFLYLFRSSSRAPRALRRSNLEPVFEFPRDFFHAAHTASAGRLSSLGLEAPIICRGWQLEWLE